MPMGLRKGTSILLSCRTKGSNFKWKGKAGGKKNAYIHNFAAISRPTSLLFVSVNSPCSPVSVRYSILYTFRNAKDHWPCFGGFTWGIVEGRFFVFLSLWRLFIITPWILNEKHETWMLYSHPSDRSHRSLTDASKHWRKVKLSAVGGLS